MQGENLNGGSRQLPSHTPSARPASISSSPTLPPPLPTQPPVPRPRGNRGPPPRPPPRAYSPVATDLVSTRQFTYAGAASSGSSTSPTSPPPANSAGMAMVSDQQRLSVLNSNDTAFKRFSFTGINITPAMISKEASQTSRNVDIPAQSTSSGKEQIPPPKDKPTSENQGAASVVMSKIGDGGMARGFALARMTRTPANPSQPRANHVPPQQQDAAVNPHRVSWPASLSAPVPQTSQSTGDINERAAIPSHLAKEEPQRLSNGDIGAHSGLTNGFQSNIHQSVSSPNIAPNPVSPAKAPRRSTSRERTSINSIKPKAAINGHASSSPDNYSSHSSPRGFEYAPVPESVANRRSPVPESSLKTHASNIPQGPASPSGLPNQHNPSWPKRLPLPQNSAAQSSDSSLNQVSIPGSVASVDQSAQQKAVQEEAVRHAKSTPSTPTRSAKIPAGSASRSTPTTPTKQLASSIHQNHNEQEQEQQPHHSPQHQLNHRPQDLPPPPPTDVTDAPATKPSNQSSNGGLNQTITRNGDPAHKEGSKAEQENPADQKSLTNGIHHSDGRDRISPSLREMKQKNMDRLEDLSKRLSIPSMEERQRMGVIETSL